jgi:hypothetical protein
MRANESYRFLCVLSVNHGDRIIGRVEAPFVRVKRLCVSVPSRYARAGSVARSPILYDRRVLTRAVVCFSNGRIRSRNDFV